MLVPSHPMLVPSHRQQRQGRPERPERPERQERQEGFDLKSQGFNLYDGFMKPILSLPLKSLPNVFIILETDRNLNFAANNLAHDV